MRFSRGPSRDTTACVLKQTEFQPIEGDTLDHTLLEIPISISHEAGIIVRESFPITTLSHIDYKGPVDPVTETDRTAEALIIQRLRDVFPDHRILSEESGGDEWQDPGPPTWIVDPLDGTIALVADRKPVIGVIHDPLRGETFAAMADGGATCNGRPIQVSAVAQLSRAFLGTGFSYQRRTAADNNVERLGHFLRRSQGIRRAGSAVLDLAYVACGRLDGFWELRLHPWDVAAGTLIVREAGGQVTDDQGTFGCLSDAFIVASNGLIHDEMLRVLRDGSAAPLPD